MTMEASVKKSHFFAIAAILAGISCSAPSAFAFTAETGSDSAISTGMPHFTDPDEAYGAFFGGANSESSSYFTPGSSNSVTGSNLNKQSDDDMYDSGYSIRPDKNSPPKTRPVPIQ